MIKRFCPPTKIDKSPFGSMVELTEEDGSLTTFVQVSEDTEKPEWRNIGYLLEKVFGPFLTDEEWLKDVLCVYKHKQDQKECITRIANRIHFMK